MKLVNLIVIFAICFATCLGQTINLCYSESGYLELIYDNTKINVVPVSKQDGKNATAFLPHASTYTFKCVLNHSQTSTTLKQNDLTLGNT